MQLEFVKHHTIIYGNVSLEEAIAQIEKCSQLGIASRELRSLKAMTTSKLEAYAEELYRQLGNNSLK